MEICTTTATLSDLNHDTVNTTTTTMTKTSESVSTLTHRKNQDQSDNSDPTFQLDSLCDSKGIESHTSDDWSDAKHSERKSRDRLIPDHIVVKLIKKSDYEGFKRLIMHLLILFSSGGLVWKVWQWETIMSQSDSLSNTTYNVPMIIFKPLFLTLLLFTHGFIIQCLSYCVQHETLHRTAFKTRQINIIVSFLVSLPCFEFSTHERIMHKGHHTWTNDPDRDPELTSFYDKETESGQKGFRKVPFSKWEYWQEMIYLHQTMKSHFMRLWNCALGTPVDYSGVKWSPLPESQKRMVRGELQWWAILHFVVYGIIFSPLLIRSQQGNGSDSLLDNANNSDTDMTLVNNFKSTLATYLTLEHYLILWLVPAILGFIPISICRNAEHADCSADQNCLTNTRSCMSSFPIRFLMWNMNLHREHHLYPAVPFFNLPRVRQELEKVANQAITIDNDQKLAHSIMRSTKPDGFWETNKMLYEKWIDMQMKKVEVDLEA